MELMGLRPVPLLVEFLKCMGKGICIEERLQCLALREGACKYSLPCRQCFIACAKADVLHFCY